MQRGVDAFLATGDDVAEVGIGEGDGEVFAGGVGEEGVEGGVFFGDGEVVGLGADLGADGQFFGQEPGSGAFELGVEFVVDAAEA